MQQVETTGIADASEGVYVAGSFKGTATAGDISLTSKGETDAFVARVSYGESGQVEPPQLTSISPRAALPGATITISGAHLLTTAAVRFSGAEAIFTVLNDSSLTAVVPVTAGSGKVEVETAGGKAASEDAFIVLQPSIIVFAPDRGYAGSRVFMYGRHLATAKEVSFNGVPAQDFTVYNDFSSSPEYLRVLRPER